MKGCLEVKPAASPKTLTSCTISTAISTSVSWTGPVFNKTIGVGATSDPVGFFCPQPKVIRATPTVKRKKVLEIGCGDGTLTTEMARFAKSVVGIDYNPQLLDIARQQIARQNLTNVTLISERIESEE
ncbi:MAG: class I SAM-dependent methyltransferase [Planctomycetes bacterium]|nr:class I SAM-dependent methyltransferase [Planctomycetota bacterium]